MLLTKPSFPDDTFLLKNMEPSVYFVSRRRWESECCWGWTALANTTAPSLRADESFQKALFSDAFTHSCSENSNSTKLTSSNCWKLWKKLHPSTSYPLGLDIYISVSERKKEDFKILLRITWESRKAWFSFCTWTAWKSRQTRISSYTFTAWTTWVSRQTKVTLEKSKQK